MNTFVICFIVLTVTNFGNGEIREEEGVIEMKSSEEILEYPGRYDALEELSDNLEFNLIDPYVDPKFEDNLNALNDNFELTRIDPYMDPKFDYDNSYEPVADQNEDYYYPALVVSDNNERKFKSDDYLDQYYYVDNFRESSEDYKNDRIVEENELQIQYLKALLSSEGKSQIQITIIEESVIILPKDTRGEREETLVIEMDSNEVETRSKKVFLVFGWTLMITGFVLTCLVVYAGRKMAKEKQKKAFVCRGHLSYEPLHSEV